LVFREPVFDRDIATIHEPPSVQPSAKRFYPIGAIMAPEDAQEPDLRHHRLLLRTRRQRPRGRRAADERDELAAPHMPQ
jgi:hypothetical protein